MRKGAECAVERIAIIVANSNEKARPMSLARLDVHGGAVDERIAGSGHVLILLPQAKSLPDDLPELSLLQKTLARRQMKPADLAKTPVAAAQAGGGLVAYAMIDAAAPVFDALTTLRKAAQLLLDETPQEVAVYAAGSGPERLRLARLAAYVLWINGKPLPQRKRKPAKALQRLLMLGDFGRNDFADIAALARAGNLARALTALPPDELTPKTYRAELRRLAREHGWQREEFDQARLAKMGANAFLAVARGSDDENAAIVRLSWQAKRPRRRLALVGKGICFDSGGLNLKPARHMAGMHEDMNGSAVALAILQAAAEMRWPVAIDCWLAISRNEISPAAYRQNEIVTALDGTSIEIVHTDAEGRMVLADTLALASRAGGRRQPDLVIDFATLTGSMQTALGTRYAGAFASSAALAQMAVDAGTASGERVCLFPMEADYGEALDSKVADIKQCTLEGEADHILAACFLRRFTNARPWIHVDLSAARSEGGLGAVSGGLTGFGVAWGLNLIARWLAAADDKDAPQ
jgi:leucyl aminopeptidase